MTTPSYKTSPLRMCLDSKRRQRSATALAILKGVIFMSPLSHGGLRTLPLALAFDAWSTEHRLGNTDLFLPIYFVLRVCNGFFAQYLMQIGSMQCYRDTVFLPSLLFPPLTARYRLFIQYLLRILPMQCRHTTLRFSHWFSSFIACHGFHVHSLMRHVST